MQTTSALSLAKLLIYDRVSNSQILSRLLLLWFNPISEDRPAIRRGLACFFADYACGNTASAKGSGRGNFEHQASLADAVLPTLTTLLRAPASSPLAEIEAFDVASLLSRLTDTSHLGCTDLQPTSNDPVEEVDLDDGTDQPPAPPKSDDGAKENSKSEVSSRVGVGGESTIRATLKRCGAFNNE